MADEITVDHGVDSSAPTPGRVGAFALFADSGRWRCSTRACALLGLPTEARESTTEEVLRGIHPDDVPAVRAALARCLADGQPFAVQGRLPHPGGEEARLLVVGEGGATSGGAVGVIRGFFVDATGVWAREVGREATRQVLRARASQEVIDQARGILMLLYGLDAEAAFAVLIWQSQRANVKVHRLARLLVDAAARELELPEATRHELDGRLDRLAATLRGAAPASGEASGVGRPDGAGPSPAAPGGPSGAAGAAGPRQVRDRRVHFVNGGDGAEDAGGQSVPDGPDGAGARRARSGRIRIVDGDDRTAAADGAARPRGADGAGGDAGGVMRAGGIADAGGEKGAVRVVLSGDFDLSRAPELENRLLGLLSSRPGLRELIVDVSGASRLGAAVLAVLATVRRRCVRTGITFRLFPDVPMPGGPPDRSPPPGSGRSAGP